MHSIININKKVNPFCPYFCRQIAQLSHLLLKPLFKYPITLFILLSTGYSQVFAHLFRPDFPHSPTTQMKGLVHFQAPATTAGKEDIYFEEEENRRISLKEYSRDNIYTNFFHADLSGFFFERLHSYASFCRYFSRVSFSGAPEPEFIVLRL